MFNIGRNRKTGGGLPGSATGAPNPPAVVPESPLGVADSPEDPESRANQIRTKLQIRTKPKQPCG